MKKIQTRYPQIDPPTPPVIKHGNGKSTIYFDAGFPIKKNKKNKYLPRFPHLYNPDQSSHKCPWTIAGCRSPSPLVDPFRWSTPGPDVDWKGHSIDLTLKWFPCVTSAITQQKCHYMHRKWHLLHDVIPLITSTGIGAFPKHPHVIGACQDSSLGVSHIQSRLLWRVNSFKLIYFPQKKRTCRKKNFPTSKTGGFQSPGFVHGHLWIRVAASQRCRQAERAAFRVMVVGMMLQRSSADTPTGSLDGFERF